MIETSKCYIEQLPNGIVRVETKEGVRVSQEDLAENDKIYKEQLKIDKALFLVVFGPEGISNFQSQKKFADNERGKMKIAEAIVVKTVEHNLDAKFFTKYFEIDHPLEIFSNEEEATRWLLAYKKN